MGAVGGDIIQLAFTHPTLSGATFYPKANEESTYDLGGIRTDDDESGVDGGGTMIQKKTRRLWMWEGTIAGDMNTRQELEALTALAGNPVEATWKIAHINNAVYQGTGTVVGDVQENGLNATIKLKIAGSQQLVKISG
jgi:hypothetical protein